MAKGTIAAQLYTVREFMQTPADIAASLKKVAKAGYRAVEMAGLGPLTAQQWKDLLDKNGLSICSSHTGMDRLQSDFDAVVAEHELWGAKQVNIPSMPAQYREGGEQGFLGFAAAADELGAKLRAAGLRLGYHNHSFEFVRFGKKVGLQLILDNTDPANLMSQMDTYWVQHGGGDPAAWTRLVKGRSPYPCEGHGSSPTAARCSPRWARATSTGPPSWRRAASPAWSTSWWSKTAAAAIPSRASP